MNIERKLMERIRLELSMVLLLPLQVKLFGLCQKGRDKAGQDKVDEVIVSHMGRAE